MPGLALESNAHYMISTPKLVEFKLQFKEMLGNGYIRSSVSPWHALVLFVRKKDGTLIL